MKRDSPTTVYLLLFGILIVRILPVVLIYKHADIEHVIAQPDPLYYLNGARAILKTGLNPANFFPPLNFLFIAGFLFLGKGSTLFPTAAIAIVGWLTVVIIYLMARELFGEKAAIIASIMGGLYPNFIIYAILPYAETLAVFWIAVSLFMIVKYFLTSRNRYLILGSILWALASHTRGGLHYFSVFLAAAILIHHVRQRQRTFYKPIAIFLLATYSAIFAVGIMVSPIQGDFSLNSKSGLGSIIHGANRITTSCADYGDIRGNIFYFINHYKDTWPEGGQLYSREIMKRGTLEIFQKVAAFILQDPLTYLKNSIRKLSCLWSPNQLFILFIKTRFYHPHHSLVDWGCLAVSLLYVLILCGGLLGLAMSREPFRLVFIFFILFYCAMIFFTVGNSKLRLPMMPFFIIYCSYFFTRMTEGKLSWKSPLINKWVLLILLPFIANSIYKYGEIRLLPEEVNVRQIELCNELGFYKTASHLLERYRNDKFYTQEQRERLEAAAKIIENKSGGL